MSSGLGLLAIVERAISTILYPGSLPSRNRVSLASLASHILSIYLCPPRRLCRMWVS
jgi:hypothetical protein